jgi:hypothetical protein
VALSREPDDGPMPSPSHSQRGALRARDAGLRKISVATRVLVVGSVAAAGVFASMAAWAQPGRAKAATNPTGLGSVGRVPTATVPPATVAPQNDGGSGALSPPTEAPTTAAPDSGYQYTPPSYQYSPPPAVSGAS